MPHFNTGRIRSPETRAKISAAQKGKTYTAEQRRHFSEVGKARGYGKWMTGRRASIELRRKLSLAHRGSRSQNWKGGVTSINVLIRDSLEYKLWREAVFKQDDFRCWDCGERGGSLEAHHVWPFAYYPRLRFDVRNGQTMCRKCHRKTFGYLKNIKRNQF